MQEGKVKWFNNSKGYGFIRPDNDGEDLFVHYSYIDMSGYKTLKAGQKVSYDIQQAPKGQHAVNVLLLDTPELEVGNNNAHQSSQNTAISNQDNLDLENQPTMMDAKLTN